MTLIAVTGDCTTTTCVALASGWTADVEVIVLEADPSGGSLAGWLSTPATPTLASAVAAASSGVRRVRSAVWRSGSRREIDRATSDGGRVSR